MAILTNDEVAKARRAERRKLRRAQRRAEAAGLNPAEVVRRVTKSSQHLPEKDTFYDQVVAVLKERFPDTKADPEDYYWFSFSTDLCRDLTPEDAVDAMLNRLMQLHIEPKNWVLLTGHIIGFGPNTKVMTS